MLISTMKCDPKRSRRPKPMVNRKRTGVTISDRLIDKFLKNLDPNMEERIYQLREEWDGRGQISTT